MKGQLDKSLAYKYFMSYRLLDGQRYDESVVPYKASGAYRKSLRKFLKKHKNLQLLLSLFIACVAALALTAQYSTLAAAILLLSMACTAVLALVPMLKSSAGQTHIGVGPKGIRFYSLHWYGDSKTNPLNWKEVSHIGLAKRRSMMGESEWVEIYGAEDKKLLDFCLDGIAAGKNRKRLLAALKQHVSVSQIDLSVQDALNPVKPGKHTELWLEVLSSSARRLAEDRLSQGNLVCNGRYKVLEQLGAGGQAVAYIAEQLSDDESQSLKRVVLKEFVLPAEASLRISKRAFEAIERESALLRQVSHPRISALLDLFVDDQRAYMVLEWVPGESLRDLVAQSGPFGERDLTGLALQMAEILKHLHSLEPAVIHRDFTPDNLILDPESGLKLIDFNVAEQYEASATRTVVGKHSYIPPEQFRGRACPQSDLYALGATLFYLLTGQDPEPIAQSSPRELMPMISPEMNAIVAKCTAQELSERYASASEIIADLGKLDKRANKLQASE